MSLELSAMRRVIGCMTGTSIDGLDAAVVEIAGSGLTIKATLANHKHWPLGALGDDLRDAAEQKPMTAEKLALLALRFGEFHAACLAEMTGDDVIDLVVVHGQTVFHAPPVSWQLVNAHPIAGRLRVPVLSDLRQADLLAGGQGAPISPLADWVLFRSELRSRVAVNLGGFCNVTYLPARCGLDDHAWVNTVLGSDVCACNHVLDGVARRALGAMFDADGAAASAGASDAAAAEELLTMLEAQSSSGRSLGTRDELVAWIDRWRARLTGPDLAASAVEALASRIAEACDGSDEIIAAGGGARNLALVRALTRHAGKPVLMTDHFGIGIEAREAVIMAVLGALCQDRHVITLASVTGRGNGSMVAGSWILP